MLENVDAVDLDFLGLNYLDPPRERLDDQIEEDTFCQRLLLLGAKWFSSKERQSFVHAVLNGHEDSLIEEDFEEQPRLLIEERLWICVG